jgi:LacI family transcriptional regulator
LRGLILLGGEFDYTAERVADLEVPFVCCTFTGSFGSLNREGYSSVSINDYAEAYRAVSTLLQHGHRNIAVVLAAIDDRSISELRYRGYCDALRDAGITPSPDLVAQCGSFEMPDIYRATEQLVSRRPDITALFTISDLMAMAAIKALHSAKLQVPTDCSVISIDGLEMTRYTVPTLTSLVQPAEEMGTQAVRILTEVLKGTGNHRHIRLSTALRDGETVANIHL